jgi:hypothetical protein
MEMILFAFSGSYYAQYAFYLYIMQYGNLIYLFSVNRYLHKGIY